MPPHTPLCLERRGKDSALEAEIEKLRNEMQAYGKDSKLTAVLLIAVISLFGNRCLAFQVVSMKRSVAPEITPDPEDENGEEDEGEGFEE